MKKILLIIAIPYFLLAGFKFQISKIPTKIAKEMIKKGSWREGCPVELYDLRYIEMSYWDFKGKRQTGKMVVHKSVANDVVEIFGDLYSSRYPINQMRLIEDYNASDFQSIEADNTSAFNCRRATGSKKWSNHSYGKAIDINPIENPYISKSGHISHKKSLPYRKRIHRDKKASSRAIIRRDSRITRLFKAKGWKWGGDWRTIKDYQHFEKSVKNRSIGSPKPKYIPLKHKKPAEATSQNLY
ncbi:MAG: M15 family peptidase [Epsilonproteobacteria bacterium]|nr:MAG: M15 family peptidase [Campylobacterota bacterium]